MESIGGTNIVIRRDYYTPTSWRLDKLNFRLLVRLVVSISYLNANFLRKSLILINNFMIIILFKVSKLWHPSSFSKLRRTKKKLLLKIALKSSTKPASIILKTRRKDFSQPWVVHWGRWYLRSKTWCWRTSLNWRKGSMTRYIIRTESVISNTKQQIATIDVEMAKFIRNQLCNNAKITHSSDEYACDWRINNIRAPNARSRAALKFIIQFHTAANSND
jgi:hypothetical protein